MEKYTDKNLLDAIGLSYGELSLKGKTLRANFYKCGDKLQQMHFLSWNPIDVPKPDFHRPDFFGEVTFQ